jgi:Tol biopolymer transport system component
MSFARIARTAAALSLVAALWCTPAAGQVFGKNKVQYEPLDWAVIESPHLRLHYYAEEESLARRLVVFAESVCVEYDGRFRVRHRQPIPFLLYSVHHLFQQTNATPDLISEGTGGLTELIKGRVLLPHTGSWSRLEWVTRHELTHAYMLEKLARVMKEHHRSQGYLPPLWFIEGLAEFCGTTWDADAEGLLRDAVISGEALPVTRSEPIFGTVLMYKEGQSFLLDLAERYGGEKVFDLLDNWYRADDFETVFRITYGMPLAKADEDWFSAIRRRYYPAVARATNASEVAQPLTRRGHFNLGPRVLPNASPADTSLRFCYFSASENGVDLMINEPGPNGRRRETRVLRGGASPSFESFHLFQNRPDASPSGLIALSSKHGGRDALYLVDSRHRRVVRKLEFPMLVALNDPALVAGDSAAVFSAQDYDGRSDLYRASWGGGTTRLERLTNDDFDDIEPDVSPDGRWVVFSSDRCDRGGRYSIYRLALSGGIPEAVSDPAVGDDRQPVFSPDGRWLAYRSTRGGTSDLYVRPAEPAHEARRVTRLIGPAYDPDWLPSGHGLLFTAQEAIRFQAYRVAFDPESLAVEREGTPARTPAVAQSVFTEESSRYQRHLSLDLAQNAVSFDPGLGTSGGIGELALSDVLGNEQLYFFLANDSDRFGNFWDGFEGGVTYVNRARRMNWGMGVFRLTQVYDVDLNEVRRERRIGVLGLASYPFSKFTRVEGTVLVRHASDHLLRNGQTRDADLVSNYVALVHDNARWTLLGPSAGVRVFLAAGFTRDISSGEGDFTTLLSEIRSYFQPLPQIVSATRVQGQSSQWRDAQRFYLGGWGSLRGYDRRAFVGTRTVMVQQEFRFPLMRGLTFAIPAPWSFPTVSGSVFADWGWTWLHDLRMNGGSVGAGFYIGGGYYPALRWDYVWPTPDFHQFPNRPRTQFSIGYNF